MFSHCITLLCVANMEVRIVQRMMVPSLLTYHTLQGNK